MEGRKHVLTKHTRTGKRPVQRYKKGFAWLTQLANWLVASFCREEEEPGIMQLK